MRTRSSTSVKGSTQKDSSESTPLSDEKSEELIMAMEEVTRSKAVPLCVKKALGLVTRQLSLLLEEKNNTIRDLRSQNEKLRQTIMRLEAKTSSAVFVDEFDQTVCSESMVKKFSEDESERRRSIIIGRVPEVRNVRIRDRVCQDFENVCNILHFLGVECYPVAVYRLGRPIMDGNRLLKVILPCSKFQRFAVERASRLRFFPLKGIYIRPSLSFEERNRQRNQGVAREPVPSQSPNAAVGSGSQCSLVASNDLSNSSHSTQAMSALN